MGGGLVEHVSTKVIKKKSSRRRRRSFVASSSIITTKSTSCRVGFGLQRLYDCCRNVFKGVGFVPTSQDVKSLCNILDSMVPEDFGLSRELKFFKHESHLDKIPRVTCTTVYDCPKNKFSLVLFFIPASATIPLHNHPEMTVFSKLLLGSMHIKAYDWANSEPHSSMRLASLKANSVYTAPCNTSVLYPTSGGNIHALTAITPSVVLDVIGPPYSKKDGRDCTYYKDIMYRFAGGKLDGVKDEESSYAWLKEIEVPEESKMDCIAYLGPRIIETPS